MKPPFHIPAECKLYTAEQSRNADNKTINEFGIDGFTLMELAAEGASRHILELQNRNKHGLFICGKGNNAGDALAVARYLINDGAHSATIYPVFGTDNLSPDAEKNQKLLKSYSEHGANIAFVTSLKQADLSGFDYIVDGIFGTGLKSDLKNPLPEIIYQINASQIPVYAMDIPSGLDADTGRIRGASIHASKTFTFGTNKLGFLFDDAPAVCGDVVFIKLPFPQHVLEASAFLLNQKLYENLPDKKVHRQHKYDGGVVHIVAGSEGLTGAAIMAAKSAWKQSAGAVFLYTPKKLLPVYEATLPQVIKIPVGSDEDTFFKPEHAQQIKSILSQKKGTLLTGPGIGTREQTKALIIDLLKHFEGYAVIDADALAALNDLNAFSVELRKNWILTPHKGEAVKWLNGHVELYSERFHWADEFQKQYHTNIFLKGSPAILSLASSKPFITGYNTAIFNRAGFGDVLSGAIAANISLEKSIPAATIRTLYETYVALTPLIGKQTIGPENLL
ncbi:MAG: NAD(P)H-hydrate epimerase [Balneolaceae bacterium]|nr:MAG: NAD(P)H-hydrate epimerase [Balneolaceae bacterium]